MMWALLWKEWREQRWRLAACCLLVIVAALMTGSLAEVGLIFSITMLPILLCMGLIVGERSGKTLGALAALPTPSWKPYLAKTIAGLTMVVIVSGVGFVGGWLGKTLLARHLIDAPESFTGVSPGEVPLVLIIPPTLMLMWMLVLTMRARTPTRVGAIGVLFLIGTAVSLVYLLPAQSALGELVLCFHPLGIISYPWGEAPPWTHWGITNRDVWLVLWLGNLLLLWFWGLWRFKALVHGWSAERRGTAARGGVKVGAALRPRGGMIRALVWKDWREMRLFFAGTLAMGLGIPVVLTACVHIGVLRAGGDLLPLNFLACLILALVMSTAPVCADLSIRLAGFWQSRTVTLRQWYWSKYWLGLAAIVLCAVMPLTLSLLICYLIKMELPSDTAFRHLRYDDLRYWERMGDLESMLGGASRRLLIAAPIMLAVVYSTGVLVSVLVRHTFYAAILTLTVLITMLLLPEMWREELWRWNALGWAFDGRPGFRWGAWVPMMAGMAAGLAWLGRVAVERGVYLRAGAEAG